MNGPSIAQSWHLVDFDPHRYQAVGFGGRPSHKQDAELRRLLKVHLGHEHEAMFAAPAFDPEGYVTSWTTWIEGPVAPLTASEGLAGAQLSRQLSDIRELIGRLRNSERSEDRGAAALLSSALRIADADLVFAVGSRPCIAGWGFASDDPDPLGKLVKRVTPYKTPPPQLPLGVDPVAPRPRHNRMVLSILFAVPLLMAVLFFFASSLAPWVPHELPLTGAWEYRGALGEPGSRSALLISLVLKEQAGASLHIITDARADCRVTLSVVSKGERMLFQPTDRVGCAHGIPPAILTLDCALAAAERLFCDLTWGDQYLPQLVFIEVGEEGST